MVSSTSATCNATVTDPAAAIDLQVPAAYARRSQKTRIPGKEQRSVPPEAEGAGRTPEVGATRLLGWARVGRPARPPEMAAPAGQ